MNDVSTKAGWPCNFEPYLDRLSTEPVTVHFQTRDLTAHNGSDYKATSGTLVIPAGQLSGRITITTSKWSQSDAYGEGFAVVLDTPTNATLADPEGTCGIFGPST